MASGRKRRSKGVFNAADGLPVAGRYLRPVRRRWTILAGFAGCAVALAALGLSRLLGGVPASPGPVSSSHATFERDCAACHASFRGPATASCQVCHEKVGDARGSYGFAAHYAFRSGRPRAGKPALERPCAACHPEHRGREAAVTAVPDAMCRSCHRLGSFERGHPEFQFAREHLPDDAHLRFSHRPHVREVSARRGYADLQLACLACHEPDERGDGFRPLDFDRHCDECHLDSGTGTPRLPVGDPADLAAPGVETLEAIQRRRGPGIRWAFFTNPEEFQQVGAKVSKRPVVHEDPWILENLRRIRRTLHPEIGLAELLRTSVDHGTAGAGGAELSREAIATLREQAAGLRGRPEPEVQEELERIEALLAAAEKRVGKGEAPPAGRFAAPAGVNPKLTGEQAAALERLALDLTEPCRQCHVVSQAAILRVQTEQHALGRAEFSHRAHLLLRPFCTDCHGAIPGLAAAAAAEATAPEEPLDVAETQNLPTIAVCRACHTSRAASDRCVTCHLFHPGAGHADLVVYRRGTAGG